MLFYQFTFDEKKNHLVCGSILDGSFTLEKKGVFECVFTLCYFYLIPGLYLMGFKPQKSLKIYYKVKPASFIYPDEQVEEDNINCSLYVANVKQEK